MRSIETWALMWPSDWTWIAPTRRPPARATSVVTPGAVSARWVRSTSSEYSVQPSAATSAISPSRWACVNGSMATWVMRPRGASADPLSQGHDDPIWPAHVGHAPDVLVLADAADQAVAVRSQLVDCRLQVVDLE